MRQIRPAAAFMLATLTTGCYALQPVGGAAAVPENTRVAFDITDVGRVALGGPVGPSVSRIEGRLVRKSADSYVVSASDVHYIGGGNQAWSGEPITLKPEYIATAYSRRFSKGRTLTAAALGAGAVAVIVTRGIIGGGDPPARTEPIDSGATSRGRRP